MGRIQEEYDLIFYDTDIDTRSQTYWINMMCKKKGEEKDIHNKKTMSLIVLMIIVLLFCVVLPKINIGQHSLNIFIVSIMIILGIIIQICISSSVHKRAFSVVMKRNNFKVNTQEEFEITMSGFYKLYKEIKEIRSIKEAFVVLLSVIDLDYTFAQYNKSEIKRLILSSSRCKCEKNSKYLHKGKCIRCYDLIKFCNKFFIRISNWYNIIITCILMVVMLVVLQSNIFNPNFSMAVIISLYSLLLYRLLTRSLEIGRAFYADVVRVDCKVFDFNANLDSKRKEEDKDEIYLHKWKNSYIRKPERISLAVHSLLELILTFTMIYMLTFVIFSGEITSKTIPYITGSIYEFFLYSLSVSFFNISYMNYSFWIWNIFHVWQVTMSIVLIILSIAAYIGEDDDMAKRESNFYASVLNKERT